MARSQKLPTSAWNKESDANSNSNNPDNVNPEKENPDNLGNLDNPDKDKDKDEDKDDDPMAQAALSDVALGKELVPFK